MKVELQGEGTYTYECNDPYCYFCYMKSIEHLAEPHEAIIIKKEHVKAEKKFAEVFKSFGVNRIQLKGHYNY